MNNTAQFLRKYSITVTNSTQQIDLSTLRVRFSIHAYVTDTPTFLDMTVYNVAPETFQWLIKEGGIVNVNGGYEGNYGNIFSGAIIQVFQGRERGTDTFVRIIATVGDQVYRDGFVSTTVAAGSNVNQRLFAITQSTTANGQKVNLNVGDVLINPSNTAKLPRGKVFFGPTKVVMRQTADSCGANWELTEDNGTTNIKVLGTGEIKQLPPVHINDRNGMIGQPTQTIDGVRVRVLMNPSLVQGQGVILDSKSIQQESLGAVKSGGISQQQAASQYTPIPTNGLFKILAISFVGDTRGDEWYSDLICADFSGAAYGSQAKYTQFDEPIGQ